MLLLDRQPGTARPRDSASRPGESTCRLQLRLRADGQVLNLLPGKTTIGASPRCNIRIEQPGVQPLHCLIVDGPDGMRVRSWAGDTKINGIPFEESALGLGDCLSLGPVELEIIDPQAGKSLPEVVETPIGDTKETEQVRVGRDRARTRSRQLLATLRQERTSYQALTEQLVNLQESHLEAIAEQNSLSRDLENLRTELSAAGHRADTNSQLQDEVGRLAIEKSAADEWIRQLTEASERLQKDVDRLTNQRAELGDERDGLRRQNEQLLAQNRELAVVKSNVADEQSRLVSAELERERAAQLQAESAAAAAIADGARLLAELEHQCTEQARHFAEQERRFTESIHTLEQQLAEGAELRSAVVRERDESQLQLADAQSLSLEQSRRIRELEAQLAAVESSDTSESFGEPTSHVIDDKSAQFSAPVVVQVTDGIWDGSIKTSGPAAVDVAPVEDEAVSSAPQEEPAPATWPSQLDVTLPNEPKFERHEQEVSYIFPVAVESEASLNSPQATDGSTASKTQSTSYIDRFSHMFTEEGVASQDKLDHSYDLAHPVQLAAGPEQSEAGETSSNKSDEEESIEQYMAKLLQRVRGEAPSKTVDPLQPMEMPPNAPVPADEVVPYEHATPQAAGFSASVAANEFVSTQNQPVEIPEPAKRKVSVPAPKTDLGALRALANETARRAIGQHELRTLRRKAVTKVIVATLAGMTSLWLMLDSPDWRDVQFITGCVSLLVAAYWAGETYRTLIKSLGAAAYGGPEAGHVEAEAGRSPALPIDVEREERG